MGGWDYDTYMSQPDWFIELIKIKIDCEIKYKNNIK